MIRGDLRSLVAISALLTTTFIARATTLSQPTVDQVITRCKSYGDGSTASQSTCLDREVAREELGLARSYARFLAADLRMVGGEYRGYDPRREIADAQHAWKRWMLQECGMRADLTRGTAGSIYLPACRLKLIRARSAELDQMALTPGASY